MALQVIAGAKSLAPLAPNGTHRCKLIDVQVVDSTYRKKVGDDEIVRKAWKWVFEVVSGEHAGCEITKTTGTDIRSTNDAGELMADLHGRQLERGEEPDVEFLEKQEYDITVLNGKLTIKLVAAK